MSDILGGSHREDEDPLANPDPTVEDLLSKECESHEFRNKYVTTANMGYMVVSFAAGDELGEVHAMTQFEGQAFADNQDHGQWIICQASQNRAMLANMDRLREVIAGLRGDEPWTADIVTRKCPKAPVEPCAEDAIKVLEGKVDVRTVIEQRWENDLTHLSVAPKNDIDVSPNVAPEITIENKSSPPPS